MSAVFADSLYWIAIARPGDPWADSARRARRDLGNVPLVTTDEVLSEFLAALSKGGPAVRRAAAAIVRQILNHADVFVVPQSRETLLAGLSLYEQRLDKSYSLVDCVSMATMRQQNISDVLTNDRHFQQEGFNVLISNQVR